MLTELWSDLRYRVRALVRRRAMDSELEAELQDHLDRQTAAYERAGLSHAEAVRRARIAFGGPAQIAEAARDARGTAWLESLGRDVRYAVRTLARAPAFTASAILTTALAIGATTAVVSIVYGVLIKPLPYREPERLVRVASVLKGAPTSMSPLDFLDYQAQSRSFSGMAVVDQRSMNLTGLADGPVRLTVGAVGASFFDILGVPAARGRTFARGEDARGAPHVVVLSTAMWRDRFGGRESVVGSIVDLDGAPYTIVGVAPPWLDLPHAVDAWVPLQFTADDLDPANRGGHTLSGVARLAPGISLAEASRDLAGVAGRLAREYPVYDTGYGAMAERLQTQLVRNARPALLTLLATVLFVLLVACANLASLFLSRASARGGEMAVRTALGAARGRILRQLLTESLLVAVAGAAAGLALAWALVRAVVAYGPRGLPRVDEIGLDPHVLAFSAGLTVITGVFFGLTPALQAARANVAELVRAGARGGEARDAGRARNFLVVAQAALTVVLLSGAALFLADLQHLLTADLGFAVEDLSTATVQLPNAAYPKDHDIGRFGARLLEALHAQFGVEDAAIGFGRPLFDDHFHLSVDLRGFPPRAPGDRRGAYLRPVSPAYFRLLGIPLVAGRAFTDADRADAPQVAIVNREFVRRYLRGVQPLGVGVTIGWGRDTAEWGAKARVGGEIVGVVGDDADFGATEDATPWVYVPFDQAPFNEMSMLVRSRLSTAALAREVRTAVAGVDPRVPVFDFASMRDLRSASIGEPRFYTALLTGFAALALFLAAVGIYGVISYQVALRRRDIAIRLALGASAGRILRITARQGVLLALAGVPFGAAGAWVLRRFATGSIFGVAAQAVQPSVALLLAALVLVATAGVASYLPARRAARVDPAGVLRSE